MVLAAENKLNSPQRRRDHINDSSNTKIVKSTELTAISNYKHLHLLYFILIYYTRTGLRFRVMYIALINLP